MEFTDQMFPDATPADRLQMLKDNCLKPVTEEIKINFTEEELADFKTDLSEEAIERNDLQIKLKEQTAVLRAEIKLKTANIGELLTNLKQKHVEVEQEVYYFDDQAKGLMFVYNGKGELVYSRKLFQNERQTNLLTMPIEKQA